MNIYWWIEDDDGALALRWKEQGGPPVSKPKSSGFGSALITAMGAQQLGGKIEIDWNPEGIVVNARLPASTFRQDPAQNARRGDDVAEDRPRSGTILIVEDELLVGLELAKALKEGGWTVIGPATSLEDAFRLLSGDEMPDVAILDVNLQGQPVYPVADLLEKRKVPFVFCTGYEELDHGDRYSRSPVLRKPTSMSALMSELYKVQPAGKPSMPPPQLA